MYGKMVECFFIQVENVYWITSSYTAEPHQSLFVDGSTCNIDGSTNDHYLSFTSYFADGSIRHGDV